MYRIPAKKSPYASALVGGAGFTVGDQDGDAITVNVQLKGQGFKNLARVGHVGWYLSAQDDGSDLAAAASGGVAAGDNGVVVSEVTGRKGTAVCSDTGEIDFVITDNTTRSVYLCILLPDGSVKVSDEVAFV